MNIGDITTLVKNHQKKWVALEDDDVIAVGNSVKEVKEIADKKSRDYSLFLVPEENVGLAPLS
ncbi:MAG: hypothetical protein HY220_03325 [Candidatus Sungbacteria bacterium]|uniref:DUF5678 domain-containing protein n=1 Tax=Candidatus Sungiibacteriota bacterium TaxID=2750080 RepID=A0A9D6QS75_9BACT|nr:hypothetical protein [Candidatus Sungbacteria bacterium]